VVAVFPLLTRDGILGLVFVKLLVIVRVSLMLMVSSPCNVFYQASDNCFLIAEYICSLKELMRGRRVMSLVLCHCVRSWFVFWMRTRVKLTILHWFEISPFGGMA
jgi:hypothetical protein